LNALEESLKAPSRKTAGIETVGGNEFAKSLSKLGDEKLAMIFKGQEKALARLQGFKQIALDSQPTAGAVPRGSAPVILDILNRASSLPGLAAFRDLIRFVKDAGADDRAVRRAANSRPEFKRVVSTLESEFPSILSAFGVATATSNQED